MNILKINYPDLNVFSKYYSQKFKYGGVFYKSDKKYNIGDQVFLLITIEKTKQVFAIETEVSFLTPNNSISFTNLTGFSFLQNEQNRKNKNEIEIILGGLIRTNSIF